MLGELWPARHLLLKHRDGTLEQLHRRREVAAPMGACTRSTKAACRECPEHAALVVEGTEVQAVPERLLEVVADDLLELGDALSDLVDEPGRKALVQLGPGLLEEPRIGDVADQDVAEAK